MAHDALGAHARDELGISEALSARPIQAALASAASFTAGAILPLLVVLVMPRGGLSLGVAASSLVFLALLGAVAHGRRRVATRRRVTSGAPWQWLSLASVRYSASVS
jgi:VIT1/CCC1 family predicted Fe2+/Mn2+ transporter